MWHCEVSDNDVLLFSLVAFTVFLLLAGLVSDGFGNDLPLSSFLFRSTVGVLLLVPALSTMRIKFNAIVLSYYSPLMTIFNSSIVFGCVIMDSLTLFFS